MKYLTTLAVASSIALGLAAAAATAETADKSAEAGVQPKCLEAAVNPVTGFAVCVNPPGAPVEQIPRSTLNRPCKPRAHDDDPFTVYEHWSGC